MFKYLKYSVSLKQPNGFIYEIVDDDFTAIIELNGPLMQIVNAIIQEYEKRKLNVAANLFLAVKHMTYRWNYSYEELLILCRKLPKFCEYETEMQKYMVLL